MLFVYYVNNKNSILRRIKKVILVRFTYLPGLIDEVNIRAIWHLLPIFFSICSCRLYTGACSSSYNACSMLRLGCLSVYATSSLKPVVFLAHSWSCESSPRELIVDSLAKNSCRRQSNSFGSGFWDIRSSLEWKWRQGVLMNGYPDGMQRTAHIKRCKKLRLVHRGDRGRIWQVVRSHSRDAGSSPSHSVPRYMIPSRHMFPFYLASEILSVCPDIKDLGFYWDQDFC